MEILNESTWYILCCIRCFILINHSFLSVWSWHLTENCLTIVHLCSWQAALFTRVMHLLCACVSNDWYGKKSLSSKQAESAAPSIWQYALIYYCVKIGSGVGEACLLCACARLSVLNCSLPILNTQIHCVHLWSQLTVCVWLLSLYDLLTRYTRTYRLCEAVVSVWIHLSWAAWRTAVCFAEWLKHLGAGLLFFKKKKQTVECGADSQKVM